MKALLAILTLCTLMLSCGNEEVIDEPELPKENIAHEGGDLKSRAARHVEAQLNIAGTERYGLTIYKQNLDGDDKEDAILTVNRFNYALEKAKQSPNAAKLAEIGYVGNYNYIFYYDGGLDLISPAIAVPSSPYLPLEISFEPITSTEYNDVLVTYRIRNSAYRAFFTIENHTPTRYFEWPLFDELGSPQAKAFGFEYIATAMNPRKNIQIYEADISLSDTVKQYNVAKPILTKRAKLLHEFFYLPAKHTYVTKK
ncbi:MAG: hypothetical protein RL365_10 [Bacteroidota bacterium]|jgi:hypothetical protein